MIANLQSHYGFTRMPFTASVPVTALFSSAAHKEAVARLRWLISARGIGVLTGEVGAGKTAALRAAADGLDASRHTLIYLPNPQVGVRGLHGALATALGPVAPLLPRPTSSPRSRQRSPPKPTSGTATSSSPSTSRTCSPASQLEAVRMMTSHHSTPAPR